MRTTLTLDDDLLELLDAERRRTGQTMKDVINELLREGLRLRRQRPKPRPFKTKATRLGLRRGIDPQRLNQLGDELEADDFGTSK